MIGVAAVSRAVADLKPVPVACSAVRPVEPDEFTLMTLPGRIEGEVVAAP